MPAPHRANPVLLLLCAVAALALATTGFLSDAPNRLADGVALPLWRASPLAIALVVAPLAGLVGLSAFRADRAAFVVATALVFGTLLAASLLATSHVQPAHPAQRLALGPAFWLTLCAAGLAVIDALERLAASLAARGACLAIGAAVFAALASTGVFDALSLAREFASHRALFVTELLRHIALVAASLLASVLACAPLLLVIRKSPRGRGAIFSVLGILQTIPSIALFGLLIGPLTFLAANVPLLKTLGVSGLGTTPALVALVLYAAFPLARMGDAAFSAVPSAVADAATGLGFGPRRRFVAVDLPLALPVLLSGMRVVTLQAIGLATVAALIGGGGLGTFIFEGIGEYALDLVLVGAIPVILLALAADVCFRIVLAAVETPA